MKYKTYVMMALAMLLFGAGSVQATRYMENLGRGMVATRVSSSQVYVGWRMLGTDPAGIGFNLYRQTNGGSATKLNGTVITASTNYSDTGASSSNSYTYYVKPVIGGVEQAASASFTIASTVPTRKYIPITMQAITRGAYDLVAGGVWDVQQAFVGDLNGDGEWELLLKRHPVDDPNAYRTIKLDAYKMDGTFLWRVDLGPNIELENQTQTSPVVVADFNGDGRAEVFVKTGEGTKFGNGITIGDTDGDGITDYRNHAAQYHVQAGPEFVSMVDGMTGAELARTNFIPRNFTYWGDNYGHRASFTFWTIAYLDGIKPSIVMSRGPGNVMAVQAWDYTGGQIVSRWFWTAIGKTFTPGTSWVDCHQIRAVDVDGDGKDEISWGTCMLDDNGTVLYTTPYVHGDRFQIADFDPDRAGLEVFVIQQYNPTNLMWAYYDARTGSPIATYYGTSSVDVGRGDAGDYDASVKGVEFYSTQPGMWSCKGVKLWDYSSGGYPMPALGIWWDSDLQREIFTGAGSTQQSPVLNKWNATTHQCDRFWTFYSDGGSYIVIAPYAGRIPFVGDILGDWREEMVLEESNHNILRIYTTQYVATNRIYTLMHNPAYRNAETAKGYLCTNYPDFYLGNGMVTPPAPDIVPVIPNGDNAAPTPNPMTFATAPYGASATSVAMVATTATDASGVEYLFTCTAGGGHSSSWQDSTSYTDTGLTPSTSYTYTVKARDKSSSFNTTAASSPASAATLADTTAPSPDPMTFATAPYAVSSTSVAMVATTATDISGVEYMFTCTLGGGHSSAWQNGTTYTDVGLAPSSTYAYTVTARDKSIAQNTTASSSAASVSTAADSTAPTPSPMTWAMTPYAAGLTSITMVAATASDISGVEYYFHCTVAGGHDSGWQDSATYTDTDLMPSSLYTYQVKARDKSIGHNETSYSGTASASTEADVTPPTPNPMTWAVEPHATDINSITMTATTATDISGVEYYFVNITIIDGSHDSGWQDNPQYTDTGLANNTTYTYAMGVRDKSPLQNATDPTPEASATTPLYVCTGSILSDFDGNCQVDFLDYALIGDMWAGDTAAWTSLMQFAADWLICNRNPSGECWQ